MGLASCVAELKDNSYERNKGANGAAIWQNDCTGVTHADEIFMANVASMGCPGIEINQGTTEITNCNFTMGKGVKGGAIYMQVCRVKIETGSTLR